MHRRRGSVHVNEKRRENRRGSTPEIRRSEGARETRMSGAASPGLVLVVVESEEPRGRGGAECHHP